MTKQFPFDLLVFVRPPLLLVLTAGLLRRQSAKLASPRLTSTSDRHTVYTHRHSSTRTVSFPQVQVSSRPADRKAAKVPPHRTFRTPSLAPLRTNSSGMARRTWPCRWTIEATAHGNLSSHSQTRFPGPSRAPEGHTPHFSPIVRGT